MSRFFRCYDGAGYTWAEYRYSWKSPSCLWISATPGWPGRGWFRQDRARAYKQRRVLYLRQLQNAPYTQQRPHPGKSFDYQVPAIELYCSTQTPMNCPICPKGPTCLLALLSSNVFIGEEIFYLGPSIVVVGGPAPAIRWPGPERSDPSAYLNLFQRTPSVRLYLARRFTPGCRRQDCLILVRLRRISP